MKEFPSCFGDNGVQVVDFRSSNNYRPKLGQNLVTCVYRCRFHGKIYWISVTWSKNLLGQGFSIGIDSCSLKTLCKLDIKPWIFSRKKKGSKVLESDPFRIQVYWDVSSARFGSGPEPSEGFYVAVLFDNQTVLLLGDMRKEASFKTGSVITPLSAAVFVSKREHIVGKKVFATKAQFSGVNRTRRLVIECDSGAAVPCLAIALDGKLIVQVKRLRWKFRGNHVVLVDGVAVEVFWDVHDWLFGGSSSSSLSSGVFMFRTREPAEELWRGCNDPRVLRWSWSQRFDDAELEGGGFSLVLYAWKSTLGCFLIGADEEEDAYVVVISRGLFFDGDKGNLVIDSMRG
ncbi:uncharacterized protein LOC127260454 [Andrographis paniculata]|uniref:uncharacterized protein LOC127260454 n=1 Tax=Andrographis paniculata TaxID=175694 RepID=UPI0021E7B168|nr:uncharacterized protein LOC127260454 [Andrographis paniculata]